MSFQQQKLSITSTPYQIYVTPTQYLTGYIEADKNNTVVVNITIVRWDNITIPIQLYPGAKLVFESYNCMYVYIYSSSNTYVNINLNVNPFVSGTSQVYVETPQEPTYISPEPPVTLTFNSFSASCSRSSKTYNVIQVSAGAETVSTTPVLLTSTTFTTDSDLDTAIATTNASLQSNISLYTSNGAYAVYAKVTLQSSNDPNYASETQIGNTVSSTTASYVYVNFNIPNLKLQPNTTYTLRWYFWTSNSNVGVFAQTPCYIYYPLAVAATMSFSPSSPFQQTITTTLTRTTATTKSTAIRSSSQVSFSVNNPNNVTVNTSSFSYYGITASTTTTSIIIYSITFWYLTSSSVIIPANTSPSTIFQSSSVILKNSATLNLTATVPINSGNTNVSVDLNRSFSLGTSTSGSITISYSYSLTINAQVTLQLVYLPYILTLFSGLQNGATSETTIIQYTNADVIKQRLMNIQASANVNTTVNLYINGTNVQSFNILTGNQTIDLGYQYMLNKNDTVKLTYIQSTAGQFSCNLDIEMNT